MRRGQLRRLPRAPAAALLGPLLTAGLCRCFVQGGGSGCAAPLRDVGCQASRDVAEAVPSFGFDALSVPGSDRIRLLEAFSQRLQVAEVLQVPESRVQAYLQDCLEAMPSTNPYHGPSHVVDILQFLATLLEETGLDQALSSESRAALFLAGAAHDLDHTGTTNAFLTRFGHAYVKEAVDGVGPMESHSAQRAQSLLQERLHLSSRSAGLLGAVRLSIHGTDLARHQQIVACFTDAMEAPLSMEAAEKFFSAESEQGVLLLQVLLKAGDVSNPTRPFATAKAWNSQVYEEFYAEGDQVLSSGGKPNPLHDRRTNSIPKSSVGFIKWVKSIFLLLRDFLSRCQEAGVRGIRPEGLDAVLANLDANAASFAKEAARLEAADASKKVSEIHSGR